MDVDWQVVPVIDLYGAVGLPSYQVPDTLDVDTLVQSASVFVAGYDNDRLVKSEFVDHWRIKVNDRTFYPRQWVDTEGNNITDIWNGLLYAIIGTLLTHPGTTLVGSRSTVTEA